MEFELKFEFKNAFKNNLFSLRILKGRYSKSLFSSNKNFWRRFNIYIKEHNTFYEIMSFNIIENIDLLKLIITKVGYLLTQEIEINNILKKIIRKKEILIIINNYNPNFKKTLDLLCIILKNFNIISFLDYKKTFFLVSEYDFVLMIAVMNTLLEICKKECLKFIPN